MEKCLKMAIIPGVTVVVLSFIFMGPYGFMTGIPAFIIVVGGAFVIDLIRGGGSIVRRRKTASDLRSFSMMEASKTSTYEATLAQINAELQQAEQSGKIFNRRSLLERKQRALSGLYTNLDAKKNRERAQQVHLELESVQLELSMLKE